MVLDVFVCAAPKRGAVAGDRRGGLSAAFNAPLAGICLLCEERCARSFRYNLISIKAVFTGGIMSSIVFRIFNGERRLLKSANAV